MYFMIQIRNINETSKTVAKMVGELLISSNMSIAIAESCTGGMISSMLVGVPGISKVFDRGIISYSNKSKAQELSVSSYMLSKYGAVSENVAAQMARGIRQVAGTDLGVAITGIAGPKGGSLQKPVGLVYVAISTLKSIKCSRLELYGSREQIISQIVLSTLKAIHKQIFI